MAPYRPVRLALVALGAAVVAGQTLFSGLNSCGTSCANTALNDDSCSNDFSDISCICSSSQFANNGPYSCCVIENCPSGLDAIEAQAYVYGYCLEYHPVPSSPACPTASLSSSFAFTGFDLPTGTGYPYSTGGAIPSFTGSLSPSISDSFSSGQDASGTTSSGSGGGLSTGAIVGIVVGVVGGLAILGGIIILCLFRRRQKKRQAQAQPYPNAGQQGPPPPLQPQQQQPPMMQQQQQPPYGQQQQPYGGPQQGPFVGGFAPIPSSTPQSQQQGQQYQTVTSPGYAEADSRTLTSNAPTNSTSPNTTGFSSPSNTYASAYGPPSAQDPHSSPFQQNPQAQSAYASPIDGGGGTVHEAPGANAAAQTYAPYKPQEGGLQQQQQGYSTYSPMQEMPGSTQQH